MDIRMTPEELDQIAETEREAQGQFNHRVHVCVAPDASPARARR